MNGVLVPCIECSELTLSPVMGRCQECSTERRRERERGRQRERANRTDRVGPSSTRWKRLRARAVALQDWCSDCTETRSQIEARGDRLEVDHTPSAWAREADGQAVRLEDVDVTCGSCNRARGGAQPGSQRWNEWVNSS